MIITKSIRLILVIIAVVLTVLWIRHTNQPDLHVFQGHTMGTTYSVKARGITAAQKQTIAADIERTLVELNQSMSHYIEDSEISRFNRHHILEPFNASKPFFYVVAQAQQISEQTHGAFDITIAPLIDLWGFGAPMSGALWQLKLPEQRAIDAVMTQTGFQRLWVKNQTLQKRSPKLTINLSAIAKGYGVDVISELLETHAVEHYLVEIGGEIRAKGEKSDNKPWIVAIERPISEGRAIQKLVALKDKAMATSGDYRNYFEKDGQRYSHTLDPRTGQPIAHTLVSVTVIAHSALEADALATALMVMGPEKGLAFADKHEISAFFITKSGGEFVEYTSNTFIY